MNKRILCKTPGRYLFIAIRTSKLGKKKRYVRVKKKSISVITFLTMHRQSGGIGKVYVVV